MPGRKIVDIPFIYEVSYLPPRARNERTAFVRDRVGVIVRALDDEAFPVAMRAQDWDMTRYEQIDDIRTDGMALYRPFTYEPAHERIIVSPDVLDGNAFPDEFAHPFGRAVGQAWRHREAVDRNELDGRVVSDNRQTLVSAIHRRAAELVLCDGKVFQQCGEPYYRIRNGSFRDPAYLTVEFASRDGKVQHPSKAVRADRLEEFGREFPADVTIEVHGSIELLIPESCRLQVAGPALLEAARRMCESMGSNLNEATIDRFILYADLRDALKEVDDEISDPLLVAVDAIIASENKEGLFGIERLENMRRAYAADLGREPAASTGLPRLG